MTREGIIADLWKSGTVKTTVDYWMRGATWDLRKEMMQEVWLWLCTYDEQKLFDAEEHGLTNALITSFIRHQWRTRKSIFTIKYCRHKAVEDAELFNYIKGSETPVEPEDDDRMWTIKTTLSNLPEEEKKIWDTYLQTMEYKLTAEQLSMNPWQVKYAVDRIRKKVAKALKWKEQEH